MQQHFESAQKAEQAGDHDAAASEYRAFLAEALHRVANGKAETGDFNAAAPLFDEALSFVPQDSGLLLDYAAACLTADKLPKAKTLAAKAVEITPQDPRARFLYGRILFHLEDYPAAKVQLEAAVAANPDFDTGYLLGKTYLLLQDLKEAQTLFSEMISGLGDTALIHIYFGRAYSATDYPDLAISEFKEAIAKDSYAKGAHYYLALAYLGHNEEAGYDKAIPEFQAEININPDDFPSHYMLGYIASRQRRFTDAETELTRAEALNPRDLNTLLELASVYTELNQPSQAEAILRKAIAVADSSPGADPYATSRVHYMLGQLLAKSGRAEEAQRELKIFADMEKQRSGGSAMTAEERTVSSGNILRKDVDKTDTTAEKSVSPEQLKQLQEFVTQLSPAIANAYNNIGASAADHKDFATAAEYFGKALHWNPALEEVERNMGVSFYYAGQYGEAIPPLTHFLQNHSEDLLARSTLALSFFQLGSFHHVVDSLQRAKSEVDKDPKLEFVYAVSLVKTGEYLEGIERLKALENATPNSPQIHAALEEALAEQKNAGGVKSPQ
jgi:tetratricopeptide (TPR) repeat protein